MGLPRVLRRRIDDGNLVTFFEPPSDHDPRRGDVVIRLGRISYVNMAPVFYGLEADVEEVAGVPTELNRMLLDGELDIAPIPSIEYARNADRLRILPRLCVSSEGAVDSIQLVTRVAVRPGALGRGHAGERDLGRARADPAAEGRDRPARRRRRTRRS